MRVRRFNFRVTVAIGQSCKALTEWLWRIAEPCVPDQHWQGHLQVMNWYVEDESEALRTKFQLQTQLSLLTFEFEEVYVECNEQKGRTPAGHDHTATVAAGFGSSGIRYTPGHG